jgi:hypothetical protein
MEYGLTHEYTFDDKRLKDSRPAMARRIMRSRETGRDGHEIFVWGNCFVSE